MVDNGETDGSVTFAARDYSGSVLATCLVTLSRDTGCKSISAASLLVTAVGPDLRVLDLEGCDASKCLRGPLGGAVHIHGLRPASAAINEEEGELSALVAVFGPQKLTICSIGSPDILNNETGYKASLVACLPSQRLTDWPLDVAWIFSRPFEQTVGSAQLGSHRLRRTQILAVALSLHRIELWSFSPHTSGQLLGAVAGPTGASFLYSAALHSLAVLDNGRAASLLHASGTFSGSIILWRTLVNWTRGQSAIGMCEGLHAGTTPEAKLIGHQGAIFRVRFFLNASVIVSVSDDRTARLWVRVVAGSIAAEVGVLPSLAKLAREPTEEGVWHCHSVMRGHNARVWDAALVTFGGGVFGVVTACEDSVVRLFSEGGDTLRELQGHRTRGVRCVEAWPETLGAVSELQDTLEIQQTYAISGGEDGAVKLWPLSTYADPCGDTGSRFPTHGSKVNVDGPSVLAGRHRMRRSLWSVPEASDWIREVALPSDSKAIIVTNFGRIYEVSFGAKRLVGSEGDEGEQIVDATLLYSAQGLANLTCCGIEASESNTSLTSVFRLWCGCADGRLLALCARPAMGGWRESWLEVFSRCRVSAVFACGGSAFAKAGFAAVVDHGGRLSLWRDAAPLNGTETSGVPVRFADFQLELARGEKNQRLLCAVLVRAGAHAPDFPTFAESARAPVSSGLRWVFGDEHGHLHVVDGAVAVRHPNVHSGKVLSLCDAGWFGSPLGGATLLFSSGSDGAVVRHRLDSSGCQQLASLRPGCGIRQLAHLAPLAVNNHPDDSAASNRLPFALGAFQAADFILWDLEAGVELWRRPCGGSKRPSALRASRLPFGTGGSSSILDFVFAYSSGSKTLEIHFTLPDTVHSSDGDAAAAPLGLRAPLHGREVHSIAWVAEPTFDSSGLFVTASEDATMRLVRCTPIVSDGCPRRSREGLDIEPMPVVEQHPGAVRAVASACIGAHRIVVSGGAKGVLRAYVLESLDDGRKSLRLAWSPTPAPLQDIGGFEKSTLTVGAAAIEERVMAISVASSSELSAGFESILAAIATSTGWLRCWRLVAVAPIGDSVSIVAASLNLRGEQILATKAADTTLLCVAWLPPWPKSTALASASPGPAVVVGAADGAVQICGAGVDSSYVGEDFSWLRWRPHEAGVNDIAVRYEADQLLVATAGDDQCIGLSLITFSIHGSISAAQATSTSMSTRVRLSSMRIVAGAHLSSVRSLGWAGERLLSVGLDRQLRVWAASVLPAAGSGTTREEQVAESPGLELRELFTHRVRSLEPEALAIAKSVVDLCTSTENATLVATQRSPTRVWALLVAGRGIETAELRLL